MTSTTAATLVLPLLAVLAASPALAQPVQTLPDAPEGAIVVAARVTSLDARWDTAGRRIHTYVALDVARVLLGLDVPPHLVLKQLGGVAGGIGLWLPEQAPFRVGEDVLVALTTSGSDRSLHTAGLGRGKWTYDAAVAAAIERELARAPRAALQAYEAVPPEYAAFSRAPGPLYAFLSTGGDPARWHEVDDRAPVFVDHSAVPGTWTGPTTANATAAINLWRGSGMDLDLRDGGAGFPSGVCSANFTGNGRISVSYNDPCGNVTDWVAGGGYYTTGDLRTVNGTQFQKFLQGFVVVNDTGPHTSSASCFQDAVAHGIGHALGLGHTSSAGAMMQQSPRGNCASGAGALTSDDVNGVTTIYEGIPSATAPPDPPATFTASSVLNTVSLAWTPATTGGAVQQYVVEAGTAPGVYNLGSATYPATLTATSIGGVPVGTYYLRVRARNALGTSAPSVERAVTVGACTPPGPPGTLSGTANDTLVNLLWSAPATGVAQGYRVLAGTVPGVANLGSTDYPATVTALAGNVPYGTYYVRVQALNVCGVSAPSNEIAVVVAPCTAVPQAPTALSVVKNGTFLTFSWTAPAGTPPTSYTFAVGSAPGASNLVVSPTGTTATTLAGNAPNGAYYVRVHAQNACGLSAPSNEIFVTVP
ncbi:MAG: matrixin family metalloprotease [Acidobacteria bacterium]|nr:matrixin family metalloprotease [Acidobacteriota bacterium]